MIAFASFAAIGLAVLTVVYIVMLLRLRASKRDDLEDQWHEDGGKGDIDDYVDAGMTDSQKLRRWLLAAAVYILPVGIVLTIIYLTNFH